MGAPSKRGPLGVVLLAESGLVKREPEGATLGLICLGETVVADGTLPDAAPTLRRF